MKYLCLLVAVLFIHGIHAITVERRVVAFINVFRHLHGVPPLMLHPLIAQEAKFAARSFAQSGSNANAQNSKYNANYCTYSGLESDLPQTCAVMWYTTVSHHVWCNPKAAGKASPFVNMLWLPSVNVGVGTAKSSTGKVFVVAFFSPGGDQLVEKNVLPVRVVKEAGPKAKCPPGFVRFGTSCFKYHLTPASWQDALVHCAKQNATLLSVRDSEDEKFVRGLQKKSDNSYTWIGLRDTFKEGRYSWVDGLVFGPRSCVPINAGGGNLENCVAWSTKKPIGCWSDRACAEKLPFTCRKPVEGRASYRVEILFKRQKWNPKLADTNSKAFKDFATGLVVTLKEIFTRARSGKKSKGFRKVEVKSLRPQLFSGQKPPGVVVKLSIKFRSTNSDPTLRFQRFLRPSEKLVHMSLDIPGMSHKMRRVSKANFCAGACRAFSGQAHAYCNNPYTNQQMQSSYCPLSCTTTQSSTCPSYCHQSCCTSSSQTSPSSSSSTYPSPYPAPSSSSAYLSPYPDSSSSTTYPSPYPASYPYPATSSYTSSYVSPESTSSSVQYVPSIDVQGTTVTSSYCPSQCSQLDPTCLTFCDEECCQKAPTTKHLEKLISKMKGNIAKLRGLLEDAHDVSEVTEDEASGLPLGSGETSDKDSEYDDGCAFRCLKAPSNSCSKKCSDSCCANLLKAGATNLIKSMESQLVGLEQKYHEAKPNISNPKLPSDNTKESSLYDGPIKSSDEYGAYVEQPITDVNFDEEQNRLAESLEKENALNNEDINQVYATPSQVGTDDDTEGPDIYSMLKQNKTSGHQGFEGKSLVVPEELTRQKTLKSHWQGGSSTVSQYENQVTGAYDNKEEQDAALPNLAKSNGHSGDLRNQTFVGIEGLNSLGKEDSGKQSTNSVIDQIEQELSSQPIDNDNKKKKSVIFKYLKSHLKQNDYGRNQINHLGKSTENEEKLN